jgi:hypothetical protein
MNAAAPPPHDQSFPRWPSLEFGCLRTHKREGDGRLAVQALHLLHQHHRERHALAAAARAPRPAQHDSSRLAVLCFVRTVINRHSGDVGATKLPTEYRGNTGSDGLIAAKRCIDQ